MSGFSIGEADTLAGPVEDGMRNGGYLKKIETALNDELQTVRYDDIRRTVYPSLIERVTRAHMEMAEDQPRDAARILALLGPIEDFGVNKTARHFAERAAGLCHDVLKRDGVEGPRL
jgi:hypothetical protein